MPDVNLDRLRELAGYIRDARRQLGELATMSEAEFLAEPLAVNSAKYLLIVVTEAALDICNHVVARRGGRSPSDYADCIAILTELRAIDAQLEGRLVRMARFRNLLVHLYWRVDDRQVYRVMREDLGDIDAYLTSIGAFVGAGLSPR